VNGDLAALQGVWKQVAVEVDGVANPPDEFSTPGTLTTITGTHFAVHASDGTLLLEGDLTLDEATVPKRVTWVDSMGPDTGKRLPAIYDLNGDDFVFNAADEGAPFPATFRTLQRQTMRRFVRKS
jgi:uncharacterized protein (TIGR03067 family)